MQNRREFIKAATVAAIGTGLAASNLLNAETIGSKIAGGEDLRRNINKHGSQARMKLSFFPYELKLQHVFTVATYSRTTTPDVQVEIEYDGLTGYGEASMPPYLQNELGSVESVCAFLKKAQEVIGQFADTFQQEDILAYFDALSEGNAAAKAAIDIALHDLVSKL